MPGSWSRRDLLQASGATFLSAFLSGCLELFGSFDNTPTATPAPVPSLEPTPTRSPVPDNTILVGPDDTYGFEPESLRIQSGTTVTWVWESDVHNIVVINQPDQANWEGHLPFEDAGFNHEHTFSVAGRYLYGCEPHDQFGAHGTIVVE